MQGFLKNTFRDHAPEPPRDLWAGIEHELRPRKRLAWLPYASAVAALLVVVVGLMWILASDEAARQQLAPEQPLASAEAAAAPAAPVQERTVSRPYSAPPITTVTRQTPDIQPTVTADNGVVPPDPVRTLIPIVPVSGKPAAPSVSGGYNRPLPVPGLQPVAFAASQPPTSARKQEYDLTKLSVDDVLLFAARSLGRVADLPFAVYADNDNPQQVKAYQVQLGERFSIERKRSNP